MDAAKRAVAAIRQGVEVLEQQPGVGRPVDDMDEESRQSKRTQHLCAIQLEYFWCVAKCVSTYTIFKNKTLDYGIVV